MAKEAHVGQKSVSSDSSSESLLEARERHWAEAKKMTLFSNAFMTVALEDPLACQHVLRILTGKKDLVVREIRTQYQIAKITLHDAIMIDSEYLEKGKEYFELPEVHIIYIKLSKAKKTA